LHITAKYFITFTLKCFALAVAAVRAELTQQYCWTKCAKFYNLCVAQTILRMLANSVQNSADTESQNFDITSLQHKS